MSYHLNPRITYQCFTCNLFPSKK